MPGIPGDVCLGRTNPRYLGRCCQPGNECLHSFLAGEQYCLPGTESSAGNQCCLPEMSC